MEISAASLGMPGLAGADRAVTTAVLNSQQQDFDEKGGKKKASYKRTFDTIP